MKRSTMAVMTVSMAALTVLVWLLLPGLAGPARAFTAALLVPIPATLGLQAFLLDELPAEDEREAVYTSSAVSAWVLAILAMLAARFSGFTRAGLWLVLPDAGTFAMASGATFAAGALIMIVARWLRLPDPEIVTYLIPRSVSEKIAFAGLSISAGIAEELVFRSFLIAALARGLGSVPVAAGVSIVVFAVAHAYQGWLGILQILLLGAILTAPLLITGSVYPGMAAHAALDITAGLVLPRWQRRGPGRG